MPTPVHIVAGFLGAGKTTTVRAWMAANEGRERAAVIVNDFGEAGVDAALLGDGVTVTNIPGGCVCCTAPAGLARAVSAILDDVRPDRLFIEPSGLARPQDVVDMLTRGGLKDRVALGPTLVVVDPAAAGPDDLVEAQLESADVLVVNRLDRCAPDALAAFRARIAGLWPGPARVVETRFGALPADALGWPEGAGPTVRFARVRDAPSTAGFRARSWVFPPEVRFGWDRLRPVLLMPGIARFKGLFSGDVGWFRVDVAGGALHFAATGWRRDNRADLIVDEAGDLDAIAAGIEAAVLPPEAAPAAVAVALVDADGFELQLARAALAALPGQVPDVGVVAPGRAGAGVRLEELLALVAPGPGARYVVAAGDGLTTAPAPVGGADGVLVHSLDGEALPAAQGGPFRLLAPAGSACANVKGVVRIRVVA
jgi:Ni2+-binding GTPase involved in maturation of urease and hydrogenase